MVSSTNSAPWCWMAKTSRRMYGGEAVYLDGHVVSRVRSGGYGFTVKRNIVYAYLPPELAKIGTRLDVDVFDAVHQSRSVPPRSCSIPREKG